MIIRKQHKVPWLCSRHNIICVTYRINHIIFQYVAYYICICMLIISSHKLYLKYKPIFQEGSMVMNPRIKIHCQLILSMLMWYISFIFQLYEKELYTTELQRKQMEYHTTYLTEKFQNKFNGQFLLNGTEPQDSGLQPSWSIFYIHG